MVEVRRETVLVDGSPYEAEASLNNCSGLWTSVLRADGRIRGNGAGYTPEEAIRVAVQLLTDALKAPR